jgi:malate synthase
MFVSMPPKSNLSIVIDYLEAYQVGLVQVCQRRGAIPIGGMNAMMPPVGL